MEISGLHILLTYQCTYECDHCFVWGSPEQTGTFTIANLVDVFKQASDCPSIQEIYFEGGESFLFYPILLVAVSKAHEMGFRTGIVTNSYWSTSSEDATLWLEPLKEAGLDKLDVSSDLFHGSEMLTREAQYAAFAANQLDLGGGIIQIEPPSTYRDPNANEPGEPVTGGDVMYRGRAAVKLTTNLPTQPWDSLCECPYEDLVNPGRLHLDPFGNLHICQGLVIGNLFQTPLKEILATYQPEETPIIRELLTGGPARLIQHYKLNPQAGYVDACHLCYSARQELRGKYSEILTPNQMYGVF